MTIILYAIEDLCKQNIFYKINESHQGFSFAIVPYWKLEQLKFYIILYE